jgi:acyl-coenzyme A thioesterase PaaI-like protein
LPSETSDERFRRVAAIFETANFLRTLGVRLEAVGPGSCETSLVLTAGLHQQHGFAHAGVVTTLADHTAGGAARPRCLRDATC